MSVSCSCSCPCRSCRSGLETTGGRIGQRLGFLFFPRDEPQVGCSVGHPARVRARGQVGVGTATDRCHIHSYTDVITVTSLSTANLLRYPSDSRPTPIETPTPIPEPPSSPTIQQARFRSRFRSHPPHRPIRARAQEEEEQEPLPPPTVPPPVILRGPTPLPPPPPHRAVQERQGRGAPRRVGVEVGGYRGWRLDHPHPSKPSRREVMRVDG